jgi:hypothetical protein
MKNTNAHQFTHAGFPKMTIAHANVYRKLHMSVRVVALPNTTLRDGNWSRISAQNENKIRLK